MKADSYDISGWRKCSCGVQIPAGTQSVRQHVKQLRNGRRTAGAERETVPMVCFLKTGGGAEKCRSLLSRMNRTKKALKRCRQCKRAFQGGNRALYCDICQAEKKKEWKRAWYERNKHGQVFGRRRGDVLKRNGFTLEFCGGKWFWSAGGLRNGPFDTIRSARKDAAKAFGFDEEGEEP